MLGNFIKRDVILKSTSLDNVSCTHMNYLTYQLIYGFIRDQLG